VSRPIVIASDSEAIHIGSQNRIASSLPLVAMTKNYEPPCSAFSISGFSTLAKLSGVIGPTSL
jgi:hypothetical protein